MIIALIFLLLYSSPCWAGEGAASLLIQGQQCKKNLQGETQYASTLHDERDQYEQQDAALVIQRDGLKKQIQELGKQLADLQKKVGVPHQQITTPPSPLGAASADSLATGSRASSTPTGVATPSPAASPAKSRTQPGWPNPSK